MLDDVPIPTHRNALVHSLDINFGDMLIPKTPAQLSL
jgi:hypothetical protein